MNYQLSYNHISKPRFFLLITFLSISLHTFARQYELNTGWKAVKASEIKNSGEEISTPSFLIPNAIPATVPGTVLTTLLNNHLIPDPFYGMNNELIPDIYKAGEAEYTYWFTNDFTEQAKGDEKVWLMFRGINNSGDVYMNGHKVNDRLSKSMYLRQRYDITPYLAKDGRNRLAVIVYPPDPAGNPNGGQGGDGVIARNITAQYTAGWDWIQPTRDRNTGIWDKVFITKTGPVTLGNTHVETIVPGARYVDGEQQPATLKVSTELSNTSEHEITGALEYKTGKKKVSVAVTIPARATRTVYMPGLAIENPKLWWPNGYGPQNLQDLDIRFLSGKKIESDKDHVTYGIRQLEAVWNKRTGSRELRVNGQRIFIKGGNRILSDALLRFSTERYDAEARYLRDMNLDMVRVWGGGITERPGFYDACDKYGLLVMQDFWVSGDCNGRWYDPLKLDDTTTRRGYPDDHMLFAATVEDQVKMLRNHPSLAFWCGGNEIRPSDDIMTVIRTSVLPLLDSTRYFFSFSNDDSMSLHGGDGPYTIQPDRYFWEHRSFPFNSETGSVGIGDMESLERFLPKENMVVPYYDNTAKKWIIDPVWRYHKYSGYDSVIEAYGHATDVADFARKAQLVNFNQYRAMMEGASARMWDWYTGIMNWKTQNPWTAMVGQMYDVYLDPNACMYGLASGARPLHIMYDPVSNSVRIANNGFTKTHKLHWRMTMYEDDGRSHELMQSFSQPFPSSCSEYGFTRNTIDELSKEKGMLLGLRLTDAETGAVLDNNMYWLPDSTGKYPMLAGMPPAHPTTTARRVKDGVIDVAITAPYSGPIVFFTRISVVGAVTKKRILPAFSDNNYISVLPGDTETIRMEYDPKPGVNAMIRVEGWNTEPTYIPITK